LFAGNINNVTGAYLIMLVNNNAYKHLIIDAVGFISNKVGEKWLIFVQIYTKATICKALSRKKLSPRKFLS